MGSSEQRSEVVAPGNKKLLHKVLSELPDLQERVILKQEFIKLPHESLGITIIGGKESQAKGIFVKSVNTEGICYQKDILRVGDQVLMVNKHSLRNVTHDQAVDRFKECDVHVKLIVSRLVEKKRNSEEGESSEEAKVYQNNNSIEEPILLEHKHLT